MQDSSRPHRTFTAGFKQAQLFLRSLTVMKEMVPSARLIVKNGEIQVLVISEDRNANASLVMEASTAASWTSGTFAVQFCLSDWIELLVSRVNNKQENQLLWIYKIGKCPDLFCLLGNDRSPIRLGEAVFVKEEGMDLENLRSNRVTVELTSECLREIISTCASRYDHVMMIAMTDSVTFLTASDLLRYHTEDGECVIECVEPRTARYLLFEWRQAEILHNASWLSDEVLISHMVDETWKDWMLFSCFGDEWNFFAFMVRGSDTQIVVKRVLTPK
ncbi:hypothetical protein V2J09_003786 [Rumex salicifolius]